MKSEEFLKPKLIGGRFEGNAIPLDFLRDFVVLNDILFESARAAYYKGHPDRQRLPKGFTDDCVLALSAIERGSVLPVIVLLSGLVGLTPEPAVDYFRQARGNLIAGIRAAAEDGRPADHLTPPVLTKFKSFGERLRDGESIEFDDSGSPVRFTKEVRRKLLLSAPDVDEVSEEIELRGLVTITNQAEKKFTLRTADGTEVPGPMGPAAGDHYDNIMEATEGYRDGVKIHLQGVGIRNRQGRLIRIDSIESSSVLSPLDVPARLEELRCLKRGWFDGEGEAFDSAGMDWLENSLREHYEVDLPDPHVYPSPDGLVVFEWATASGSASLEIDLRAASGYWHVLDPDRPDDSTEEDLKLADAAGWKRLAELLADAHGSDASDR